MKIIFTLKQTKFIFKYKIYLANRLAVLCFSNLASISSNTLGVYRTTSLTVPLKIKLRKIINHNQ